MRLIALGIGTVLLLLGGSALGASGKEGAGAGKGSAPSGVSPGAGAGQGSSGETRPEGRDIITGQAVPDKPWEVGAAYEYHRLFIQSDLEGAAVNKNLSYFAAYGRYDITPNDRVSLRLGLYQYPIADQGESGVRMDDIIVSYTHYLHLPLDITARGLFWLTAPTSFASQKAGIITVPRLAIGASRPFFKWVDLDMRVAGDLYIVRYAEAEGGNPNPKAHLGLAAGLVVTMPFHPPLQAGFSVNTGYTWYYEVGGAPPTSAVPAGTVQDPRFTSQSVQQSYGGEIYVRYNFPAIAGIRTDVTLALANGDPTLGYASVLHDGNQHVYGLWRQNEEFYGTIGARY